MLITAEILGQRLQQLRKSSKLTQKELAEILDIGAHNITRLERGENVGMDVLIPVINHFKKLYSLETLFADAHFILKKDQMTENVNVKNLIIHEKLKDLQLSINDIVNYVRKETNG